MNLTSNALPGFYPAVYRQDVSLPVEALGPAPDITPAGTLAHHHICRLRAKLSFKNNFSECGRNFAVLNATQNTILKN